MAAAVKHLLGKKQRDIQPLCKLFMLRDGHILLFDAELGDFLFRHEGLQVVQRTVGMIRLANIAVRQCAVGGFDITGVGEKADAVLADDGHGFVDIRTDAVKAVRAAGQQQRLLLSRALAGTPDILLLDDATSALDFKTESAFRQALREQSKATTTIIIAQRISAVMHCDQILVMEDGEMLGLGTHEELMQSCPLYQEIAALQIGGEAQ